MNTEPRRQIIVGLSVLLGTIIFGTVGYEILEPGMSFFDSFYMTIITVSTTGFKEVHDLSLPGRILTIFLIVTGVTAIAYSAGRAIQAIIYETEIFWRKRMDKKIENISQHYVVCGYGRMGMQICESLYEHGAPFVVIENDEKKIERLKEKKYLFLEGDATSDDSLIAAKIKVAKGLVAVVKTDAENVFTVLAAKELSPNIFIVSRAIEEGTESKLKKAGADRVVKPYELGGNRMVQLLLRPGVIDFIENVARDKNIDIGLEEILVSEQSSLVGKSLIDSPIRKEMNIIIVAIYKEAGKFLYNPQGKTEIAANDKLIAIGEIKDLAVLTDYCIGKVLVKK